MIKGSGDRSFTHYSAGVAERAKANNLPVVVAHSVKGTVTEITTKARIVHRPDLLSRYSSNHVKSGQGKYIDVEAYTKGHHAVVGAQYINPYLKDEGAYSTIVSTFMAVIGSAAFNLRARITRSFANSVHLLWEGRRTSDNFVVASEWMTGAELWAKAQKVNPDVLTKLRKSKSGRESVVKYKNPQEKFMANIEVLRRARCIINVADGQRKYCGGATPYSMPLEQCGFAIDKRFLTYRITAKGEEYAQYYYRLVIGRSEPHDLPAASWAYETLSSNIAYLNECNKTAKAAKATAA